MHRFVRSQIVGYFQKTNSPKRVLKCVLWWTKITIKGQRMFSSLSWDEIKNTLLAPLHSQSISLCCNVDRIGRSLDWWFYIQISCRSQKCKRKVPPPSLLKKVFFKTYLGEKKLGEKVEEFFDYIFGIYNKFGYGSHQS